MDINSDNCWQKIREKFDNLPWTSNHKNSECDFKLFESKRLCLKIGKCSEGITCKVQILQGKYTKETLSRIQNKPIPNGLSLFSSCHGIISKEIQNEHIKGTVNYIGFLNDTFTYERVVPFGKENDVMQELGKKLDILREYIRNFVDEYENNISSQADNGNDPTHNGNSDKTIKLDKNEEHHVLPSDFDPYGKKLTEDELEAELGIKRFPVSKYCEQVRDFGKQPLEINLRKNTYYFTKIRSKETNSYEYHLYRARNNEVRKGEPIHIYDIAAWPMTNTSLPSKRMPEDMPFDPKSEKRNGETMPICGIENPTFNPHVIILGMNPSETASVMQDTSGTAWKNGYNALANIFLNSFLSGGYFTDVIKCYPKTNLTQANSFLKAAITNDGEVVTDGIKEYKWYELYSLIISNELEKICKIFDINKKSFTFLVCGPITYKKILNYKGYNFINVLKKFGNIYIMGRHYSGSPLLGRDTSRLESCRRIYDDIEKLTEDGKKPTKMNDLRRYDFALLEDKEGHLHAYKGNTPPNSSN